MSTDNLFTGKNRADRRKEAKGLRTHKEYDHKYRVQKTEKKHRELRAKGVEKRAEANRVKSSIRREAKKTVTA